MFDLLNPWKNFNQVIFYLTLVIALVGVAGNGLVLWHLGINIRKGVLNTYLLHVAAADFLFLCCQAGFSIVQVTVGVRSTLFPVITFLWFVVGLWLLAAFCTESCILNIFPSCYKRGRPKHTSTIICALIWALALPAVLLPAHACGLLHDSSRPLVCLRYHATSIAWLLTLVCVAFGSSLLLFWVTCCTLSARPKFYDIVRSSGTLVLFCRLPFVIYWSLRPLLNFLLPIFPLLATLLACTEGTCKPLMYFMLGRQFGKREPLRTILQRALGDEAERSVSQIALPLSHIKG
ncbi:mas-related G-protein coupled receptor member G [Ctenodactylus gundi]